jgi:hypothetical protein
LIPDGVSCPIGDFKIWWLRWSGLCGMHDVSENEKE